MTTVNGIQLDQARRAGEMCNVTNYNRAEIPAYVIEDGDPGWLDHVRKITIHVILRPGIGTESHLFDRAVQRIALAIEGKLFLTDAAAKRAAETVRKKESLGYAVEVEQVVRMGHVPIQTADKYDGWEDCDPADLEAQAEAIRNREIAKAHKAAMRDCYVFRAGHNGRTGIQCPGDFIYEGPSGLVLPATCRGVRFSFRPDGAVSSEYRTVRGSRAEMIAALRAAGYHMSDE